MYLCLFARAMISDSKLCWRADNVWIVLFFFPRISNLCIFSILAASVSFLMLLHTNSLIPHISHDSSHQEPTVRLQRLRKRLDGCQFRWGFKAGLLHFSLSKAQTKVTKMCRSVFLLNVCEHAQQSLGLLLFYFICICAYVCWNAWPTSTHILCVSVKPYFHPNPSTIETSNEKRSFYPSLITVFFFH